MDVSVGMGEGEEGQMVSGRGGDACVSGEGGG